MLIRRMPLMGAFNELRREMDELLDGTGLPQARWPAQRAGVYPALNVWDEGDALHVEAEVPGVNKDDLEIFVGGNELTIKGRRPAREGERFTYHRRERGTGEFTRVLTLPSDVNSDQVDATLKDGVLTIRLPKAESAKPRKIALKVE